MYCLYICLSLRHSGIQMAYYMLGESTLTPAAPAFESGRCFGVVAFHLHIDPIERLLLMFLFLRAPEDHLFN